MLKPEPKACRCAALPMMPAHCCPNDAVARQRAPAEERRERVLILVKSTVQFSGARNCIVRRYRPQATPHRLSGRLATLPCRGERKLFEREYLLNADQPLWRQY